MKQPRWTRPVVRLLAVAILAIVILAMVAKVVGLNRAHNWDNATDNGMALNTAVALAMTGLALYLIARSET